MKMNLCNYRTVSFGKSKGATATTGFLAALKKAAYSSVRVTHILLLTGVFQGHECRSNGSILGAWGTFKFFLEKIFDAVIRSNMVAIFFFSTTWGPVWWRSRNGSVSLTYCHMSR